MNPFLWTLIPLFCGAFGAIVIKRAGPALGLTDHPNARSSHIEPVPRGGGVGISAAFAVSCLVFDIPLFFFIPGGMVSLISLWDDLSDISPWFRLLSQGVLALGVALGVVSLGAWPSLPLHLTIFFTIFIAGTANCYNFMDGINGIAAITGIVGFGLLFFHGKAIGADPRFVTLSFSLSIACLGFLPFNFPRASVFMGDTGSILLGFVFAGLVLVFSKTVSDFLVMAGFMLPFYTDEALTMGMRLRQGDHLFTPHRKHIYQVLVNEIGISHWKISILFGGGQLLTGIMLCFVKPFGLSYILMGYLLFFAVTVPLTIRVRKREGGSLR